MVWGYQLEVEMQAGLKGNNSPDLPKAQLLYQSSGKHPLTDPTGSSGTIRSHRDVSMMLFFHYWRPLTCTSGGFFTEKMGGEL